MSRISIGLILTLGLVNAHCAMVQRKASVTNPHLKADYQGSALAADVVGCYAAKASQAKQVQDIEKTLRSEVKRVVGEGSMVRLGRNFCEAFDHALVDELDVTRAYFMDLIPMMDEKKQWQIKPNYAAEIQALLQQQGAKNLVVPVVEAGDVCREKRNDVRDAQGRVVMTVGTGQKICYPSGRAFAALLVINQEGWVQWRSGRNFKYDDSTDSAGFAPRISDAVNRVPTKTFVVAQAPETKPTTSVAPADAAEPAPAPQRKAARLSKPVRAR